tara:strand:+ start:6831 stop:7583 length:753 start_codon:yes stop_codon:yes gene_type:complete
MKFKILSILFLNLNFVSLYCQKDIKSDTIPKIYESERNYIGFNCSPIISVFLNNNSFQSFKVNSIYKKNFGKLNTRISFNYLTNFQNDFIYSPSASTDTSITYRFSNYSYNQFDVRFGFEQLRYLSFSRFHLGLDIILGYGKQISTYNHSLLLKDSIGNYTPTINNLMNKMDGNFNCNYFATGLDISFGMDLFLSESIVLTFQLTPQFNYLIVNSKSISVDDPLERFVNYGRSYPDFKIGYFDLLLTYKF